jgi:site-specific DNA recombinase
MNMKNYGSYARKSSEAEERQVLSIDSQVQENKVLAQKLGVTILPEFLLSESMSAKKSSRPVFNYLIGLIEQGKLNCLIVWHPDRLSRNPEDSGKIITLLDSGKLLEVITPSQTFRNNPMDKFMLGFFMMQAKLENDNKGENVKRGLKTKAEMGYLPSGAKPGYMNDKYADKGNKKIQSDPVRFPLIKKAWELMLTGFHTPPEILKKLNNEWGYRTPKQKRQGGKPMSRSMIYKVFTDTFYYGEFEYQEKLYTGKHEPMITREEFERVQILLGRKGVRRPQTHDFTYTGIIHCGECKAMVTAEEKHQIICSACKYKFSSPNKNSCPKCSTLIEEMKNPKILHYTYYHCTKRKDPNCSQGSIKVEDLEKQIDAKLAKVQISERFKGWAIKYLNELNDKESIDRSVTIKSLHSAYNDCVTRLDNLLKMKISPQNADGGLLSDEEYKKQKDILTKEKLSLEEKMGDTGDRITKWIKTAEETFNFAIHARYTFTNGDNETKRHIFQSLGSNLILKDKIVHIDLEKPLNFIEEIQTETNEDLYMLEPNEKTDISMDLEDYWTNNPHMLRD